MKLLFIFVFFILFSSLISSTALGEIDSPRKQMANGISAEDVVCKEKLQLMIRSNGTAICLKSSSVEKWIDSKRAKIVEPLAKEVENVKTDLSDVNHVELDIYQEKILVQSVRDTYTLGSTLVFTGEVEPNKNLEITLEDSEDNEVYVDILEIGDSGFIHLEIMTDESFTNGAYFLILKQGNDSEIIPIQIGETVEEIAVIIEKFHHDLNSNASVEIFGPASSEISLIVLDSRDDTRFEETISLDSTGHSEYLLDLSGYKEGVYNVVLNYASEEAIKEFTVGLSGGNAPIEIKLDDNYYKIGETVLLIGESSNNTQILIELIDPTGKIIDKIEYYTDKEGKFSHPLEISIGKQSGVWTIRVSNDERVAETTFDVGDEKIPTIQLDKEGPYKQGEFVTISGTGINSESQTVIQIKSDYQFYELTPNATSDGAFSEVWQIPETLEPGDYNVLIDDGINIITTKLHVISKAKL